MTSRSALKSTLIGLIGGAVVTALALGFFALMADKTWPMRVMKVSAWIGFWAMSDWYTGFPTNVNTKVTNALLVLAGAVQWATAGLVYDLGRRILANR